MAFNSRIPNNDLPLLPPEVSLETPEILKALAVASRYLGELSGLCAYLPDPAILINTLALQESKESAELDGVAATQQELHHAVTGYDEVSPATIEVLNGTEATYVGLDVMMKRKNMISTNTLLEIVQVIKGKDAGIRNVPGAEVKNPATGLSYFPPEGAPVIREKLDNLERFINDNNYADLDPLIKMAIVHYQLLAIYPFAEGNGRVSRILNSLYLMHQGLLPQPVLYLSAYINKNKPLYYHLQKEVRENNNWQDWIIYNLAGITEAAQNTATRIKQMTGLRKKMAAEVKEVLGASYKEELLQLMFELPYLKIEVLDKRDMAHRQTAAVWLKKLVSAGVLEQSKKGKTLYFVNYRLVGILTN
jgi:Fic family protein